jgi:adenine phosphoribosyltransferase
MAVTSADIAGAIRDIPDFPKPGIVFKDITPVLRSGALFAGAADLMTAPWRGSRVDVVAAIDARGFIFGAAVASRLGVGLVPIRKKGKLPWKTVSASYDLEYGSATVELHCDAVDPGQHVLLVDDLLATGGTAAASVRLIEQMGGRLVGVQFLIELSFLNGRNLLAPRRVNAVVAVTD